MSTDVCGVDRDAGGVGGHQELPELAVAVGNHQQRVALCPRLDPVLDSVDAVPGVCARRGRRRLQRCERPGGFVDRPRRHLHPATSDSMVVLVAAGRFDESGQHHADGVQRPGCDRPSDLLGDQGEVGDAVTRDAAAAEFFGYQQARPAQFGGASPPVRLERDILRRAIRAPGPGRLPSPGTPARWTRTASVPGWRLQS